MSSTQARPLTCAVMITTRNRIVDLRRTLRIVSELDPPPDEVLVTADGCEDGTVDEVRSQHPSIRLIENVEGKGSVASRDHMLRESRCDLVLSLDDDSFPEQAECIARLRRLFAEIPELAVAHFPQRSDEYPDSLTRREFGAAALTGSYPNSGACYRRAEYLASEGFPGLFFHAYEEPDFALQMVACGRQVLCWPGLTIRHHFSWVGRDEVRTHHRHARNEAWSALIRCPAILLPVVLPWRLFSQLRYAVSRGGDWWRREHQWWRMAAAGAAQCLAMRQPVSVRSYLRWLRLLRRPQPVEVLPVD